MKRFLLGLAIAVGVVVAAPQVQAQQFVLVRSVVGSGGQPMSSSNNVVVGTVGQSVIGIVTNSLNAASQGFWYTIDPQIGSVATPGYTAEGNTLHQNFPNPFKEETKIAFTLARRSPVTLKIFGMPGQEVATLADGFYEAGDHELKFEDPLLPSGTYFYQLQVGNNILRRQMSLVR